MQPAHQIFNHVQQEQSTYDRPIDHHESLWHFNTGRRKQVLRLGSAAAAAAPCAARVRAQLKGLPVCATGGRSCRTAGAGRYRCTAKETCNKPHQLVSCCSCNPCPVQQDLGTGSAACLCYSAALVVRAAGCNRREGERQEEGRHGHSARREF